MCFICFRAEQNKQRNLSIDLIKIIAMFAVIGLHTFKASEGWRIANVFYETGVVAIPLFFMVSGYLLLGRSSIDWHYTNRKILGIVRFVLLLSLLIWPIRSLPYLDFSPILLGKIFAGAFLQRGVWSICWYLGSMIILYLCLPYLNRLYTKRLKVFFSVVASLLILETIVFVANLENTGFPFEQKIIQTFRLWNWLFYFCLGGVVCRIDTLRRIASLGIIITMLLVNVLFQEVLKPMLGSPYCEYFYSSPIVIFLSSLIFVYVIKIKINSSSFIAILSTLFLPIYVLHPIIINMLNKIAPQVEDSPYLLFVLVSTLTVIIAYLLMRIPVFNRVFRI